MRRETNVQQRLRNGNVEPKSRHFKMSSRDLWRVNRDMEEKCTRPLDDTERSSAEKILRQ